VHSSRAIASKSLESIAGGFSALSDPIRLQIVGILQGGLHCVCELREQLDVAPNLLSYHLKVLREAGLVEAARRGRWIDYRLAAAGLEALRLAIPSEEGR